MSYAVFKSGGKQYRVSKGELVVVERLEGEVGDKVTFEDVIMTGEGDKVTVGSPLVKGAKVTGEIFEQKRGRKIYVFRKRRRKNSRRLNGHRQYQTTVKVTGV